MGEFCGNYFERDIPAESRVGRAINLAHSSGPELTGNPVMGNRFLRKHPFVVLLRAKSGAPVHNHLQRSCTAVNRLEQHKPAAVGGYVVTICRTHRNDAR